MTRPPHVTPDEFARDRQDALKVLDVSRETLEKLDLLVQELRRWQNVKNLVGPSALGEIWTRHIADSMQLLRFAPHAERWLDLGSGGGFPGLVLAILRTERGLMQTDLVESNSRKCSFLRHVARLTGASVSVHEGRVEAILSKLDFQPDVVSARALSSLAQLIEWTNPLLRKGALGIFPKGQDVEMELSCATRSWTFTADCRPSMTNPLARIVLVRMSQQESPSNAPG